MAADYDLVILGGTLEGRHAALAAVGYGARVALIEPPGVFVRRQQAKYLLKGLQQLGEVSAGQSVGEWFDLSNRPAGRKPVDFDWLGLLRWSVIAAETQQPALSVDRLSAQGVDVILAMPERLSRQLVVSVANRQLRSRAVLAAFGSVPLPVFDPSTGAAPSLTGVDPLLTLDALPQNISVWGHSLAAVAWAQALNALGVSVSLVADTFLPEEDSDMRGWVRSQLIAAGIRLIDSSDADSPDAGTSDIQSPDYQRSQVSLLLGPTQPAFVLPDFVYPRYPNNSVQIPERPYLLSNQHLQTAHPRVFACGSVIHASPVTDATAQAEAQSAVWNALFISNKQPQYDSIPHGTHRFARVGRTPRFAKEGYAATGDYTTWTASSANSADLSRPIPLPAYCKLICQKGRLQSIHLIGDNAAQLATTLSSMIGQPVHRLLSFTERTPAPPVAEGLANLIRIAANQSQQARWQPYHWRRDWAENWFNWRRSR